MNKTLNKPSMVSMLMALWMVTPTAWAAGRATIEAGDGQDRTRATLEYRDDKLRMLTQAGGSESPQSTMILRDGKVYVVVNDTVLDAGQAMGMLGSSFRAPSVGPNEVRRFIALESTGRSETVAGISGKVHLLRYEDGEGRVQADEMVLSSDARAQDLSRAMQLMGETLRRSMNLPVQADEAKLQSALQGRGVLRYRQDFRIVSIDASAPPASSFELPSAPVQLPSLGAIGGQSGGSAQGGIDLGQIFGGKAQRQQERVESRTDAEIDQATDQTVDKVLDKAFDKLFGR